MLGLRQDFSTLTSIARMCLFGNDKRKGSSFVRVVELYKINLPYVDRCAAKQRQLQRDSVITPRIYSSWKTHHGPMSET